MDPDERRRNKLLQESETSEQMEKWDGKLPHLQVEADSFRNSIHDGEGILAKQFNITGTT